MNEDLKRALALMQHRNEDYFLCNGTAYEGNEDEKMSEHSLYCTDNEEDIEFGDWVSENCTEIEELAADEYRDSYMVLTDEEADEKWDEYLDNYLDEIILPELPENLRFYFDEVKWKEDAKMDGRGHCLNSYDGTEDVETVDGDDFYIYRT